MQNVWSIVGNISSIIHGLYIDRHNKIITSINFSGHIVLPYSGASVMHAHTHVTRRHNYLFKQLLTGYLLATTGASLSHLNLRVSL